MEQKLLIQSLYLMDVEEKVFLFEIENMKFVPKEKKLSVTIKYLT
jgi:hypothetical protein